MLAGFGGDRGGAGGERVLDSAGEADGATFFLWTAFCSFFGGL